MERKDFFGILSSPMLRAPVHFLCDGLSLPIPDVSLLGGKAHTLLNLRNLGFPVPLAVCVTTLAYKHMIDQYGIQIQIDLLMNSLKEEGFSLWSSDLLVKTAKQIATHIQDAFESLSSETDSTSLQSKKIKSFFSDLDSELQQVLPSLRTEWLIFRSSATAEDLQQASFAGQHETVIGVRCFASEANQESKYTRTICSTAIFSALMTVWKSMWSFVAVRYRLEQLQRMTLRCGRSTPDLKDPTVRILLEPEMSVLIMPLLFPDVAGVLFTTDPRSNPDPLQACLRAEKHLPESQFMILNSSWGLGESVASGKVSPDTFLLQKPLPSSSSSSSSSSFPPSQSQERASIYQKSLGSKLMRFVLDKEDGSAVFEPTPDHLQSQFSLTEEQIDQVAELGLRLESHFGSPQDLEFAFCAEEGSSTLFLLQSRSITSLSSPSILKAKERKDYSYIPSREEVLLYLHEFDSPLRPRKRPDDQTKYNIGEVIPGGSCPLGISIFGPIMQNSLHRPYQIPDYPLVRETIERHPGSPDLPKVINWCNSKGSESNSLTIFYGQFFVNLSRMYELTNSFPGGRKESFDLSFCGRLIDSPFEPDPSSIPTLWRKIVVLLKLLSKIYSVKADIGSLEDICDHFLQKEFKDLPFSWIGFDAEDTDHLSAHLIPESLIDYEIGKSACEIWKIITHHLEKLQFAFVVHMFSSISAGLYQSLMTSIIKKSAKIDEEAKAFQIAGRLWTTIGNVDSAGILEDMQEMCEALRTNGSPLFLRWLRDSDALLILEAMDQLENGSLVCHQYETDLRSLRRMFTSFIKRHGHRSYREIEMIEKSWRESPQVVMKLVQQLLRSEVGKKSEREGKQQDPELKEVLSQLSPFVRWFFDLILAKTRESIRLREHTKSLAVKVQFFFKLALRLLAAQSARQLWPSLSDSHDLLYFFTFQQLEEIFHRGICLPEEIRSAQIRRFCYYEIQNSLVFEAKSTGKPIPINLQPCVQSNDDSTIQGTGVSAGIVKGFARVCLKLEDADLLQMGEILIVPYTDVAWTPFFSIASAVATEIGGIVSHGAVVAREYGIPCVVSAAGATSLFRSGDLVLLDGYQGLLKKIALSELD